MCKLVDAIDLQNAAAEGLTRACAREGAIVNSANIHPLAAQLRRSFSATTLTPNDMLDTLRKVK